MISLHGENSRERMEGRSTVASVVTCVPAFNFAAGVVVPVTCAGRKRRNIADDAEDAQFSISPFKTYKII